MRVKLDKDLQKVVEEVVAGYPATWHHGVCAYEQITKGAAKRVGRGARSDVCHAGLNTLHKPTEWIVVNAHRPDWQKENPEFIRWVMKESPFAHGVINNDDEKEFFEHAGVMDTELIGNGGCLWVCKAMRHFTEDTWKPKTWDKLREYGLNGLQAFIGSDILDSAGSPTRNNTHVSLFKYEKPATLRKWYDEFRKINRIDGSQANRGGYCYAEEQRIPEWGALKYKMERKGDGWGGFIEVKKPCDAKGYAAQLKEIFEGDPKNVG